MLETNLVKFTGRGTNVNLVIDDAESFDAVIQSLRNHLSENRHMYSSGTITVNVGRRMLVREELTQIKELLENESGIAVSRFWCPPSILEEALSESVGFGVVVSPSEKPGLQHNDPSSYQLREVREPLFSEPFVATGLEQLDAYPLDPPQPDAKPETGVAEDSPLSTGSELEAAEPSMVAEESPLPTGSEPEPMEHSGAATEDLLVPAEQPESDLKSEIESPEAPPPDQTNSPEDVVANTLRPENLDQPKAPAANPIQPNQDPVGLYRRNEALFIKTTCRSGEVIRYPGDVVVLADVNPGGEIIADGDIVVFGSLRGLAHAGASGDIQATIVALNLDAHRVQIGPYIGVTPKPNQRSKSTRSNPKIAFVRRRSISVAPYVGRFAGYSGGTLYDG